MAENFASKSKEELVKELVELQFRLDEAEETLTAIQNGEIDAIVTPDEGEGPQVYTLESADYLYRILVQEMSEGVAILTNDSTIYYCNTQLSSMIQVPLEQIAGLRFNDFILPEDLGLYQAIFERGLNTKSKGELYIKSLYGTIIPVLISINTLEDLKGAYIVITDLSEQKHHEELKKAQKELIISNEKLQATTEELQTINEELQATSEELKTSNEELQLQMDFEVEAKRQLEEIANKLKISNKELEQFAYVASHDLQEPLRMVTSFIQLMERKYKGQLDKEADEYIGFIVEGTHRMKYLIDDLLEFSRLNTQAKEFELAYLEMVLDDVLSNLQLSIKENEAKITHDPLPTLMVDLMQIRQLFQNLISNAIKFHGDETPEIHISAQKTGSEWIFGVNDKGIGIDSKHQELIFGVFKRLHTRDEYDGTGIGLSICNRIVERHGGRIWVESKPNNGSTFYFTIPETI
jgi:signal transduction histidine kinase